MNPTVFHHSFSRLPLVHRLGNLGVTLNRVADALERSPNKEGARGFVREAMWFIEWTAAELQPEQAAELVNAQRQLGRWWRHWDDVWNSAEERANVQKMARVWSQRLLELSGEAKPASIRERG